MEEFLIETSCSSWAPRADISASSLAAERRAWVGEGATGRGHQMHDAPKHHQPSRRAGMEAAGALSSRTALSGPGRLAAPVVRTDEDLGAQIQQLKKELASCRAENKLLRVTNERTEQSLRKAEHESEQALRSGALVDGGYGSVANAGGAGRGDARLVRTLKAKVQDLQAALAAKEAQLGEASGQAKGLRLRELEVQTKVPSCTLSGPRSAPSPFSYSSFVVATVSRVLPSPSPDITSLPPHSRLFPGSALQVYLEEARRLTEVNALQTKRHEEDLARRDDAHQHSLQVC